MSKLLIACARNSEINPFSIENIELLSKNLEPDNITFLPPKIIQSEKSTIAIFNPNTSINIHDSSVCLGKILDVQSKWWEPTGKIPDGSYALFRSDDRYLEVVTDVVASRSIWYFYDNNFFIASTSQRAIIFFLGSFDFNPLVIPWMLSTGTLGPGYSWDNRIKFVDGNSSILLDRKTWELKSQKTDIVWSPTKRTEKEHEQKLKQSLDEVFDSLKLNYSKWVLPLSGGYDSRCILVMLREKNNLRCITWGLEEAQNEKDNDAFVAKELSSFFGLKHQYFLTDISNEPIETIFHRFLTCGEGRIDHVSGYMDGFRLWKTLFEEGIEGIIRGDQPFATVSVSSPLDVKFRAGIASVSDYENLKSFSNLEIFSQSLPQAFEKQPTESLSAWRDRLYLQFRAPFVWAALTDLKLSYVEVMNPLLTRDIISAVAELPDELRENKRIFKNIVDFISPNISYAQRQATDHAENILKRKDVVEALLKELRSEDLEAFIPTDFVDFVLNSIDKDRNKKQSHLTVLNKKITSILIKLSRKITQRGHVLEWCPSIDFHALAFRIYIIKVMHRILTADAKSLRNGRKSKPKNCST